jgi:solute carrier family 25 carnitine/acylcarnitine transporter 20/29
MQVQGADGGKAPLYKSSIDCGKTIYQQYGIKGIYKGAVATLLRESMAYGI